MTVRLRYAPSPTGHLHIGGARTALFNYLYAKHHGGQFILRIEDTDLERNLDQAADEFARNLRWLGIEWDEGPDVGGPFGPYVSTERLDIYLAHVQALRDRGYAYECYCSEEELNAEREAYIAKSEMPRYSGRCRHLTPEQRAAYQAEGRKPTVRFRVPDGKTVKFDDMIRGAMTFESDGIGGDFIIVKSNGIPTYNFAVVIDDRLMEITHVVRGEEHISNTPRQWLLYEAFGWEPPAFGHVSLILGPNGKKLSKRDESIIQFIEQYRELGYLPEALFNFLALLGWSPVGEREIFSREELIQAFDFDRVSRSGAFFDAVRLAWMNGHYLKQRAAEELLPLVKPYFAAYQESVAWPLDEAWMLEFTALYKDKVDYLAELTEVGKTFLVEIPALDEEARDALQQDHVPALLAEFAKQAEALEDWTRETAKDLIKAVQAATGVKGKALFMPIRAAVTGQLHGPDLNRTLALLGRDRVVQRVKAALESAAQKA